MAKVLSNIPVVEQFIVEKCSSTNLAKKWDIWKEDFNLFVAASGITNNEQKKALLLHVAGKEVREIYRAIPETSGDDFAEVVKKLDDYFKPKKNLSYERYMFKKAVQQEGEDAASYITRLRTLAESCEYQQIAIEIKDHFIASCLSVKLRKLLLKEGNLTLEKLQEVARGEETAIEQARQIEKDKQETVNKTKEVNSLKPQRQYQNQRQYRSQRQSNFREKGKNRDSKCFKCGDAFVQGHLKNCKAIGKTCFKCGKSNHLAKVCRSQAPTKIKTNTVDFFDSSDEETFTLMFEESPIENEDVKTISQPNSIQHVAVKINNVKTKAVVDTGSSIDVIDKETFNKICENNKTIDLKTTKKRIQPYASEPIKIHGYFMGIIETKRKMTESKIFVVEKQVAGNIIGVTTLQNLGLVDITLPLNEVKIPHENNITTILEKNQSIFEGHGKMKNYSAKLHIDETVTPVYQKMYRYPYHLRQKIKTELKRLEDLDVIEKTTGPQEWVSNVVATPKSNGDIRLCLDARVINSAIKRETFPIPTVDSIIDDMSGSTIFSKIDLKEAYTQVELDEESRSITNFHTENGIYRYKRLCYGLNNSFEKFQKGIAMHLDNMPNVKFISDDIIVYNKNIKEHLTTLEQLFNKIKDINVKINKSKCIFAQAEISFFGIVLSEKGIKADPKKIESLLQAKPPKNTKELRSFLGLCTYMSKFIEHFSEKTKCLRELLQKQRNSSGWSNTSLNLIT